MDILIACDTYSPHINGAAIFTKHLAEGMARRGHRVGVVAPSATGRQSIEEIDGVTIYRCMSFAPPVFREFRYTPLIATDIAAKWAVEDFKPTIIHAQSYFGISNAVLNQAQRLGIPTIGTNHAMPENFAHYYHLPGPLERQFIKLGWFHVKHVFSKVDLVTSPTPSAANLLTATGFDRPVLAISNGIDLQRFQPATNKTLLRKQLDLPLDLPLFLSVGRLEPEKQLDWVLKGFAKTVKLHPSHLVIVGKGQELPKLQALAKELHISERVTFAGFVSDELLPTYYAACDVFVAAGIAELQSIVTLEAMASGLPVVGVNAVALPELIKPGENGFLFEVGDIAKLSQHLSTMAGSPELCHEFGKHSLTAVQRHNMDSVLDEFEETYRQVLAGHTTSPRPKKIAAAQRLAALLAGHDASVVPPTPSKHQNKGE